MTPTKEEGLLHEFYLDDPEGTGESFRLNAEAEKLADDWLKTNAAVLGALTRDRVEPQETGHLRIYYKMYGEFYQ
jgi:hypothetical protein